MARRVAVGIVLMIGVFLATGNGALSQDVVAGPADAAASTPIDTTSPLVEPVADPPPSSARPGPQESDQDGREGPARAGRETLLAPGDTGRRVRELQARLKQIEWYFDRVTGSYDAATEKAVSGFQRKRSFAVTGDVNRRTWDRLLEMTWEPTGDELHNRIPGEMIPGRLDPRCLTGRVMCVDKSTYSLRWVVDGEVEMTFDVRFGAEATPTREGEFAVSYMSRDHVSSLYDTSMPFAMFFSGGQAVHYSPDFAAVGYDGASHGCVNVRDYDGIARLFDQVRIGDKVVVYRS